MSAPPYQDATKPIDARIEDLIARMSIDEKIAQLGSFWVFEVLEQQQFSPNKAADKLKHGIGQITRIGGASNASPTESATLANQIQTFLQTQTRLGIPAMVHEECCSGYMARGATLFPQAIGIASTWDAERTQAMGDVIRAQMRAVGGHQALAPVLDVCRDPRWGRVEETFGEDPYLVAKLGAAYVQGIQGAELASGVVATAKHFVGYGMSEGGRNWGPVAIPPREMLEVFVFPFAVAIQETGLLSVMNAYHELDGIPCGASKPILVDLLRHQLGFEGTIVSDYFTIDTLHNYHHIAKDKASAAKMALEVGMDVELPSTDCYGEPLHQALQAGNIDLNLIDTALRRVLDQKFRLGLFENPFVEVGRVPEVFDTPAQQALAYELAQKSMVLLKNENATLPLDKSLKKIAVIGPNAHSARNLMGDYSYPAHLETLMENDALNAFGTHTPDDIRYIERPVAMNTILESIQAKVSPQTSVRYALGCSVLGDSAAGFAEAVQIAQEAEVAIVVVGDKAGLTNDCSCGEARDRATIDLPGIQGDLVQAIVATGTPVILVLVNGRPTSLADMIDPIPAIVEAWLPGQKGADAVADVLFGDYNPGGKLPMTVPRSVGQIPLFYNHKPSGNRSHWKIDYVDSTVQPLFPFGYGLSYTKFLLNNLRIDATQKKAGEVVKIAVDVGNVGTWAGDEVVQLYVRYQGTSVTRPVKELKGFQRVGLEMGETRTVTFHLGINQLGFFDANMEFVIEPGTVEVMIGSSSEDIHCVGTFEIVGERANIAANKTYFSRVEVS